MDNNTSPSVIDRKRTENGSIIGIIAILLIALIAYLLWQNKPASVSNIINPTPSESPLVNVPTETTTGSPTVENISIDILDGGYSMTSVSLKSGTTYNITVTNKGSESHSLTSTIVDSGTLSPGQSKTLTVTPTNTGTFEFHCTVPCSPGFHENMQTGYQFVVS